MRFTSRAPGIPASVIGVLLTTVTFPAEAQQRGDRLVRVDTLNGGRIVVSNPDSPPTDAGATPTLVEVLRIGSLDGSCDAFGEVTSIAVDGDGRIYVADRQASEIRVFSPRGECVRTFGRSGEGPGEFRWLAGITWQPPGYLWAIDAIRDRFTVFDSLGTVLATHPLQLGRSASLPWPMWVDAERRLHLWLPSSRSIVKYGAGPGLDSLASIQVPEIPQEMYTTQSRGISALSPIPFRRISGGPWARPGTSGWPTTRSSPSTKPPTAGIPCERWNWTAGRRGWRVGKGTVWPRLRESRRAGSRRARPSFNGFTQAQTGGSGSRRTGESFGRGTSLTSTANTWAA